jgi:site-specific DNA-methyltransferase (adenine-specific)
MKTEFLDLRLQDNMAMMAEFPDKHFDLAIVDPPYGIGAGGEGFKNGSSKSEKAYFKKDCWDTKRPDPEYFTELQRVSKDQIIWGGNYFSDLLPPFRCFISWDKTIHGNSYADCELAWTSFDRVARYFRENIAQTNSEGRIHPTQKSVRMYSWILSEFANPGMKIIDTHGGSFSLAIACHYAKCHLTACEIDPDYFHAACERIKRETAQTDFFADIVAPQAETPLML